MTTQLQTGNFEITTLRGDCGAFDVTLEEGEQGDDHALDLQDNNRQVPKIRKKKKSHQGTQTDLSSPLTVAGFPVSETHL